MLENTGGDFKKTIQQIKENIGMTFKYAFQSLKNMKKVRNRLRRKRDSRKYRAGYRPNGKKVVCPLTGDAIYVRPNTTEFSQKEARKFVEWLYAWGVERGVRFTDPALEEMKDGKQ